MFATTIRGRLTALVSLLLIALLALGGIAFHIATRTETTLFTIFEHQTQPARELARIRRLVVENSGQIFRAVQHNPAFEYARLHDHPISAHLDVIEKNIKWMDETFVSMHEGLLPGSEEAKILKEFEPLYIKYIGEVVRPAMAAIRANDFSSSTVGTFIKANGDFERVMNPMLKKMAEAQENAVKTSYETSTVDNKHLKWVVVATLLLALIIGTGVAVWTIRSIVGPLGEMQALMKRAARERDFTGHLDTRSDDEVGSTATDFNELLKALRQSLSELRGDIIQIDEATTKLSGASGQTAEASAQTSESASAMAASVEEMSVSITSVSDHARDALAIARTAGDYSETGGTVIGTAVSAMGDIVAQVHSVGNTIHELGQHSEQISSVVQVIKEVADQTNLLALNAAIEAARAGEQGRGFAVVADEVRKLAERTSKATGEIAEMIGNIQQRAKTAVAAMENTVDRLESGSQLASQAGTAIAAIQQANKEVCRVFTDIDNAVREQGSVSQDIAQRVEYVAQASEQSSNNAGTTASEASHIRQLTRDMRTTVENFKV
ncbi:MAG: methyl-accepting chemotaxis protein [Bacteroidota bacterium]